MKYRVFFLAALFAQLCTAQVVTFYTPRTVRVQKAAEGQEPAPRFDYVVTAKKCGKVVKEKFVFSKGQFWADEKDTQAVGCAFAKTDLPDDWRTSVSFSVAPRDSFGNRGREISSLG